jgi:hypothetical protein
MAYVDTYLPEIQLLFSSNHLTLCLQPPSSNETITSYPTPTTTRISNIQLQLFNMKWAFIFAIATFALGAAAAPTEAAEAIPEALYLSPIKYAEFEEDVAK